MSGYFLNCQAKFTTYLGLRTFCECSQRGRYSLKLQLENLMIVRVRYISRRSKPRLPGKEGWGERTKALNTVHCHTRQFIRNGVGVGNDALIHTQEVGCLFGLTGAVHLIPFKKGGIADDNCR